MSAQHLLIHGGSVLAGPGLTPVDAGILVADGSIVEIGPSDRLHAPPGAHVVDAGGLTLAPGFIDAHVHIALAEPREVLAGGITTARDLAWPSDRIFPVVERSLADDFDGPTIVAAGPMLTAPGGYPMNAAWAPPATGHPIASEADAIAAVGDAHDRGAVVIKVGLDPHVGPTLTKELIAAVVAAAHARELKVTAHIYGLAELEKALDAGIDELAHMLMSPEEIPIEVIERAVGRGVAVVPTLSVRSGDDLQIATTNLRRFLSAGGRVIYGTDLGNEGPAPGIDRREVTAMAAAGMTPLDIVRSATVDAADWLGLERIGTLAPGMTADIVGLKGNPTERVEDLTGPALVIRRGRVARTPG